MANEEELRDMNKEVYKVDPDDKGSEFKYTDKPDGDLKKNEQNEFTVGNQEFKVLSDYGFQGMAVAPIILPYNTY